jgi:prepilin-type N-terminal cleavage/methylation domain-containing protein
MLTRNQAGFSYLEIMMVLLIIGLLLSISVASYTNLHANSLDQRRKTDIQEIRASLEQYRSVHGAYPTPNLTPGLPFGSAGLTEGTNTYMQMIPQDPQYPKKQYHYSVASDDYTLSSQLTKPEDVACLVPAGDDLCGQTGSNYDCNFCMGSYGKK